jgi:phosphinothricin acetyltransferase
LTVRAATAEDAAAIAAIWNPIIRTTTITFTPLEKRTDDIERLIAVRPVFVSDDATGFALYDQFRSGPGYRFTVEHTAHVAPGVRGRGIGRALVQAVEAHAAAAGAHSIYAGVSGENTGGIAFHAAIGFVEVARLPEAGWKFGRWIDLVLMRKGLGPRSGGP